MAKGILIWFIFACIALVNTEETLDEESHTSWWSTRVTTDASSPIPSSTTPNIDFEGSVQKALSWLVSQRESDWGWRNETPAVLMALQLAKQTRDSNSILPNALEMQLSAKQMEIEIVTLLWRHNEIPIVPPKLTQYALALSTLCQDPRQFHGHDLIGTMQHHEIIHDLDFAFTTLTACSASAHLRKKQIRRLLDIANAAKDHNIDTVAMVILALRCISKDHRHRNLQHSLRRPTINLAREQQPDGGFGNLYNTALVIQALQDITDASAHWNETGAKYYIESRQDPDGAFTDPGLTANVVLSLQGKGLGAIRTLNCGKSSLDIENHVDLDGLTNLQSNHGNDSEIRNVSITYTLWVGTNVTENYTMSLIAPRNTSFYNVMVMAMDLDPHYTFEASEWPNGHYVHSIAGYKEEPMGYHYWLLYRLPELPDPQAPPGNHLVAPVGVDGLLIEEGDHYLFWYKKL